MVTNTTSLMTANGKNGCFVLYGNRRKERSLAPTPSQIGLRQAQSESLFFSLQLVGARFLLAFKGASFYSWWGPSFLLSSPKGKFLQLVGAQLSSCSFSRGQVSIAGRGPAFSRSSSACGVAQLFLVLLPVSTAGAGLAFFSLLPRANSYSWWGPSFLLVLFRGGKFQSLVEAPLFLVPLQLVGSPSFFLVLLPVSTAGAGPAFNFLLFLPMATSSVRCNTQLDVAFVLPLLAVSHSFVVRRKMWTRPSGFS